MAVTIGLQDLDITLIELVEQCSHLYDKSDCDYKDRVKTQNSWSSIARILGTTAQWTEHRWTTLRSKFIKERAAYKIGSPSGSQGGKPKNKSYFYHALLFLEPYIQTRRNRRSNIGNSRDVTIASTHQREGEYKNDDSEMEMIEDDPDVLEYLMTLENKENDKQQMQTEKKEVRNTKENKNNNLRTPLQEKKSELSTVQEKRKRKSNDNKDDETMQAISNTLQSITNYYETSHQSSSSQDKTEDIEWNFCIMLYSQLKNLSNKQKKLARAEISAIMQKFEIDSD